MSFHKMYSIYSYLEELWGGQDRSFIQVTKYSDSDWEKRSVEA